MTRVLGAALVLVLLATPAFAQWIVHDPAALIQTTSTALQTRTMVQQLLLISERLGAMHRYRVPGLPGVPIFLPRTHDLPEWMPPLLASHVTAIDAIDEIIAKASHHVGNAGLLEELITPGINFLEGDVTDPAESMTAALNALNASEFMARRQAQADQSMLASMLELEGLKMQQQRDSVWEALLMRIGFLTARQYVDDTSWTAWRMP